MVVLLHKLVALFLLLGCASAQIYSFDIRDGSKLCTEWVVPVNGQVSITYTPHHECASFVFWEQIYGLARICCQTMQTAATEPTTTAPPTTTTPTIPTTTPTGTVTTTISTNVSTECGKQKYTPLQSRIIGGSIANANSWPWQIILQGINNVCGGSLIDSQHVLTAAHCISEPLFPSVYKVYVGAHDLDNLSPEQEMSVSQVWVHEEYNPNTVANDIAILRLATPITISDKINIICLPGAEAKPEGDTVWVSGWGRTVLGGDISRILKQTRLDTMGDQCYIYGADKFSRERQICAAKHGVGYTCQGDSGGPLMYEYEGRWYVNGVVSYGASDCGTTFGHPAVFTRVSHYLPWIRSKLASA